MNDFVWWRDGVIYQIYPRSFADSNNDGLGDLPGITQRLDYLADLGIDAIWLSPFYPTPDKDFGYDISNYTDVDPRFGTLADLDRLIESAHQRGIRIVLDLVLNHTSDQHPWFLESRVSRDNPKADWYIWRDSPNNWQSVFGGPAWTLAAQRGQHYYHMFLPEQPDVNWRNPQVRAAMLGVVEFWLKRGADGFRLDVFNVYFKDGGFTDNPGKPGLRGFDRQRHVHDFDRPEMLPLLKDLRALLDSYPDRYAVGETFYSTPEKIIRYSGRDGLHAAFSFDFTHAPFHASRFLKPIRDWEQVGRAHGIWPNYVLGNHDVPRMATRHAGGEDDARLKVLMALLLTLRGTPYLYYGEEIGMRDIHLKRGQILDPPGKRFWPFYKGRDGCRSPMQWDGSTFAGFSASRPWLPVHPNHARRNVAFQQADPHSLFHFTRKLLHLRKKTPALQRGEFVLPDTQTKDTLVYLRRNADGTVMVALNFSPREVRIDLPQDAAGRALELLLSSHDPAVQAPAMQNLAPYEACLFKVS
jgi:alpha-glucosidase